MATATPQEKNFAEQVTLLTHTMNGLGWKERTQRDESLCYAGGKHVGRT